MCPLLQVFDMPTSIAFYCDVLGFSVEKTSAPGPNFGWALLKLQGVSLMLNTAYEPDKRPPARLPARIAAHDDTCLYFDSPEVDAVYAHLRAKGLKPPAVAPYGMKQLYLHDPDGYGLCFQWGATEEEMKARQEEEKAD